MNVQPKLRNLYLILSAHLVTTIKWLYFVGVYFCYDNIRCILASGNSNPPPWKRKTETPQSSSNSVMRKIYPSEIKVLAVRSTGNYV